MACMLAMSEAPQARFALNSLLRRTFICRYFLTLNVGVQPPPKAVSWNNGLERMVIDSCGALGMGHQLLGQLRVPQPTKLLQR
jgi:hypothetical protein